jgi:hypothetical protein
MGSDLASGMPLALLPPHMKPILKNTILCLLFCTLSGCQGSKTVFEDHRQLVMQEKALSASSTVLKPLFQIEGRNSWSLKDFENFWMSHEGEDEAQISIFSYSGELFAKDFDWDELASDFTLDRRLRPSLSKHNVWEAISKALKDAYLNKEIRPDVWNAFLGAI